MRITGNEDAYWAAAAPFVERVSSELGVNIKASDNRYHSKVRIGRSSTVHKYSNELLEILHLMVKGLEYKLEPIQS
jgi:hypothetical protein